MIDSLFGSKTRVKLLHLFMSNTDKSFYVREITRLIDEQINSVRRELSNMVEVGVISSDSADNRLYYTVDKKYEYFVPLKAIFSESDNDKSTTVSAPIIEDYIGSEISKLNGVKVAIAAGALVRGSASQLDLLIAGSSSPKKVKEAIKKIEKKEGREINFAILSFDDFYYRLSVHDKFIFDMLSSRHKVLTDSSGLLNKK